MNVAWFMFPMICQHVLHGVKIRKHLRYGGSITGNSWPKICALLGYGTSDGGPLHLSLVIDNHASVILEIDELSIFSSELWLTLLDCGEDHVPTAGGGQPVETSADAVDCDDVEVLASGVVSTVHDGPHGAGKGDAELGSRCSSTTSLRHPGLSLVEVNQAIS